MKNKSRVNYEKYKYKIIEELKNGYQLKELSKKYEIVYSSLSTFIKKDNTIDYNPKLRIQSNHFKIFDENKDEIIEYLENGNSIISTEKVFKINRTSLKTKLKDLGLFKKYSHRNWTTSYVNFQRNREEIIKMRRGGYSVPDITNKFGVKRQTLKNELTKLNEYEVDVKKRKMYQTDDVKRFNKSKKEIFSEFEKGKSIKSLGKKYKVNWSTISNRLIEEGMYLRKDRFVHQFDESFFETIDSPKKSYWLGWMYSDGIVQINKNTRQKTITLELSQKDTDIMKDFKNDLKSNMSLRLIKHKGYTNSKGKVVPKTENYRFSFTSEKMFNDLGKLGVIPRKSLTLKFPDEKQVPDKFIEPFMLGYFEGDGSITKQLRKRVSTFRLGMNIVGTKEFCIGYQQQLKLIFKNYGLDEKINIRKENRTDSNTYLLSVGSISTVLVWFDSLYSSQNSIMERKKNKVIDYCKWYEKTYIQKNKTPIHMKNVKVIENIVLKYFKF